MSTATATATVEVPCDPDTAFDVFTRDIGTWWRRGNHYWNDPDKSQQMRLEGYRDGWAELLGFYAQVAEVR